ncbi:hypothetical protein LPJ53_000188 [Coemansia erecta]|uniref:C2H2-type domain-containing protein n=1 Tax=Coemansia erecta TaxID=147472 RepID=A0A9W8CU51_9FUNG|nr:hypothetical protein LPJ53_000188 [Coemansia erecta]
MADDDWHTVPDKTSKRGRGGGHGGRRGFHNRAGNDSAGRTESSTGGSSSNTWRSSGAPSAGPSGVNARSRSRPRPPPSTATAAAAAPAPTAPSFRLETANKFSLHVGKGSRARRNNELREFFATRDDSSDEDETFDAISDGDLDVSDYESEDDRAGDAAGDFAPMPVCVRCSLCADRPVLGSAGDVAVHLRDRHSLVFRKLGHMALAMQAYVDAWAQQIAEEPAVDGLRTVDPETHAADGGIRERVHREALEGVLAQQAAERRGAALDARKCLFCRQQCETRAALFRHAYREHSFNIGLPDNLVQVDEFLHILESKLAAQQCLYCEKTFTSAAVLRKHMRKKKHFKISAHNRLYDRFYVVNYAEPGRSWEEIEAEGDDDDEDDNEGGAQGAGDAWADWEDDRAGPVALALFDRRECPTPDACWAYMREQCGFDLRAIREAGGLDFYATVRLLNLVRTCADARRCFACSGQFADADALVAHLRAAGAAHMVAPPEGSGAWEDGRDYLRPVVANDPLLMAFECDAEPGDDEHDEDGSRRRLEESKRRLREQFDGLALDDAGELASAAAAE